MRYASTAAKNGNIWKLKISTNIFSQCNISTQILNFKYRNCNVQKKWNWWRVDKFWAYFKKYLRLDKVFLKRQILIAAKKIFLSLSNIFGTCLYFYHRRLFNNINKSIYIFLEVLVNFRRTWMKKQWNLFWNQRLSKTSAGNKTRSTEGASSV